MKQATASAGHAFRKASHGVYTVTGFFALGGFTGVK